MTFDTNTRKRQTTTCVRMGACLGAEEKLNHTEDDEQFLNMVKVLFLGAGDSGKRKIKILKFNREEYNI